MSPSVQLDSREGYEHLNNQEPETQAFLQDDETRAQELHIASLGEKKRLWWRNALLIAACIALWFFFATLLSVYNKWMFSPDRFGFPFPLFVTCLHMWIQFALSTLVRFIWPAHFRPPQKPTPKQYGKMIIPAALATCLDIGFSNLSLKAITLSFYTMIKNSTLIFVLIFAFLFRLEHFSFRLIGVIGLILVGVALMVATETAFSMSGFLLVISASACGGLRWSLTQLLLRNGGKQGMGLDTPPAALFWLSPPMGIILAGLSMIIEGWIGVFYSKFFDGLQTGLSTSLYILFPGALAFCMVISEFYIIKLAGVVPMSVAGILKEVTTISVSAWIFGDRLTPLNLTGVAITFLGIVLFTYHKYRKSIESTVPLDAHGNPVTDGGLEPSLLENIRLQPGRVLNNHHSNLDSVQDPLFSVRPDGEEDSVDEEGPSVQDKKNTTEVAVVDYTLSAGQSTDVERLSREEQRRRPRTLD